MTEINTDSIKREIEDCSYLNHVAVCDAISDKNIEPENHVNISTAFVNSVTTKLEKCDNLINDTVKIECELGDTEITETKVEYATGQIFCNQCQEYNQDYCIKCGALVHILTRSVSSNTNSRAKEEIPNNILELRESFGRWGIFALKVIPANVRFGPFTGVSPSEWCLTLKADRLTVGSSNSNLLSWMQFINNTKDTSEQNLLPYQYEDNLYYRSNREIQVGEELLVYIGEEYKDCLNKDVEMVFIPATEEHVKEVFACTFCCLGFSSPVHLTKHKNICLHEVNEKLFIEGLPLRKKLKKTAVPTVNCPESKTEIAENYRNRRMLKRKRKQIVTDILATEPQPQLSSLQTTHSQSHILSSPEILSSEQKYQELLSQYNKLQKTFLELRKYNRKKVKRLNGLLCYYKKKSHQLLGNRPERIEYPREKNQ